MHLLLISYFVADENKMLMIFFFTKWKSFEIPNSFIRVSGSNLLTKRASPNANALFNDRSENMKKLLAPAIYSLKVVRNSETTLPPCPYVWQIFLHGLLNFPEYDALLLCHFWEFQMFISYEMAAFAHKTQSWSCHKVMIELANIIFMSMYFVSHAIIIVNS